MEWLEHIRFFMWLQFLPSGPSLEVSRSVALHGDAGLLAAASRALGAQASINPKEEFPSDLSRSGRVGVPLGGVPTSCMLLPQSAPPLATVFSKQA